MHQLRRPLNKASTEQYIHVHQDNNVLSQLLPIIIIDGCYIRIFDSGNMAESFAELCSPGIIPINISKSILVEASAAISDTLLILLCDHSIDAVRLTTEQAVYCMDLPKSCTSVTFKSQHRATIWSVDLSIGTCGSTHGMFNAFFSHLSRHICSLATLFIW